MIHCLSFTACAIALCMLGNPEHDSNMLFILLQDNTASGSGGDSSRNSLVQQDGIHDDRHHLQKCWQGLWCTWSLHSVQDTVRFFLFRLRMKPWCENRTKIEGRVLLRGSSPWVWIHCMIQSTKLCFQICPLKEGWSLLGWAALYNNLLHRHNYYIDIIT